VTLHPLAAQFASVADARMLAEVGALVEGGETPPELTVHVVLGLTARA
jgi:hypothetical protein